MLMSHYMWMSDVVLKTGLGLKTKTGLKDYFFEVFVLVLAKAVLVLVWPWTVLRIWKKKNLKEEGFEQFLDQKV